VNVSSRRSLHTSSSLSLALSQVLFPPLLICNRRRLDGCCSRGCRLDPSGATHKGVARRLWRGPLLDARHRAGISKVDLVSDHDTTMRTPDDVPIAKLACLALAVNSFVVQQERGLDKAAPTNSCAPVISLSAASVATVSAAVASLGNAVQEGASDRQRHAPRRENRRVVCRTCRRP